MASIVELYTEFLNVRLKTIQTELFFINWDQIGVDPCPPSKCSQKVIS